MSKRVKIIVSAVAVILVLSIAGTATVVMAQDEESEPDQTSPCANDEELTEALNTALSSAVEQGLISQEQADMILKRWDRAEVARCRIRQGFMFKKVLGMDEGELDDFLAELIGEEKISDEQAEQIKERWEQARSKIRLGLMFKQVLGMDEEELDEYLEGLIGEEKINNEQAEQIKEWWGKCQEAQDNAPLRSRAVWSIRGRLNRAFQQRWRWTK
jgi:hypothetical protein